jgi:adenosylcobinamide-GDP ribazoletransferase
MIKNFIHAIQFLTIVTVSRKEKITEGDLARSMVYFPFVGFLLGVILVYTDKALSYVLPHTIGNALLVLISILLTRALHIDGLADTLDGIMGGSDKESRLRIMKDSRIGTAGVLGIVFVLLLKYLCLNNLFNDDKTELLLIAPVLSRWSQALMVFRANYVREQGMGQAFVGHLRATGLAISSAVALGITVYLLWAPALYLIVGTVTLTLIGRWYLVRNLGGVTGDAIGAVSELNEVLTYLLFVVLSSGM